jgi:GNAT superfamily N-acetyltransferase
MQTPIARWAMNTDLEFLQTAPDACLTEPILRRKIEWHEVILATLDDVTVGHLYLDHLWCSYPFIAAIRVLETHRNQGAGRAMLQFVEAHARAEGQTLLYSSSQLDEAEPQAWHRHMGFEECGIWAGHNNGVGEVFFRKLL